MGRVPVYRPKMSGREDDWAKKKCLTHLTIIIKNTCLLRMTRATNQVPEKEARATKGKRRPTYNTVNASSTNKESDFWAEIVLKTASRRGGGGRRPGGGGFSKFRRATGETPARGLYFLHPGSKARTGGVGNRAGVRTQVSLPPSSESPSLLAKSDCGCFLNIRKIIQPDSEVKKKDLTSTSGGGENGGTHNQAHV